VGGGGRKALPGVDVAVAAAPAAGAAVFVGNEGEGAPGKAAPRRGEGEEKKEEGEAAKAGLPPPPPAITGPPPLLLLPPLLPLPIPPPLLLPMLAMAGPMNDDTCGGRGTGI